MPVVRVVPLTREALLALAEGDIAPASAQVGAPLGDYLASEDFAWFWRLRAEQVRTDPSSEGWVAYVAIDEATGQPIGHTGFHGPPDEQGLVEVGYSVDPRLRRLGYARAILQAMLARADADPRVTAVQASIRPDNMASLATIAGHGFERTGEQIDEVDGLEYIFTRQAR